MLDATRADEASLAGADIRHRLVLARRIAACVIRNGVLLLVLFATAYDGATACVAKACAGGVHRRGSSSHILYIITA
jgi:hypothetical protein